jgi:hypothetical protein
MGMANRRLFKGVVAVALGAGTLVGSGCLLPYACPKLSCVRGVTADEQQPNCHAFRIDVSGDQVDIGESAVAVSFRRITPSVGGTLLPQVRLAIDYGYYVAGIALNYNVGRVHTTRVRLYRPGYQLVELDSWALGDRIVWKEAVDAAAQETAIDDLLSPTSATGIAERLYRKPGNAEVHRLPMTAFDDDMEPLYFAVFEYEHVATLATSAVEAERIHEKARELGSAIEAERLREKARELRKIAAEWGG